MQECSGNLGSPFFLHGTNVIELVPPVTALNTATNETKGSYWSNEKTKPSKKRSFLMPDLSKYQNLTRSRPSDPVVSKDNHSQESIKVRTCRMFKEKQNLLKKFQVKSVTPQNCSVHLPNSTQSPHKTVNANIRTLKLLRTKKKVTCGTVENVVEDRKEATKYTSRKKGVPHNVYQSRRPSGQDSKLQLVLESLKDKDDEELNDGRIINLSTMGYRWLRELQTTQTKISKKKKIESYGEFVSGLAKTAKKNRASQRNTSKEHKSSEEPGKYNRTGKQNEEISEENISLRSSTPTEIIVNRFELASCCSKPDSLAIEGKSAGTVLTWPKDLYGCRKSSTARQNTTSTHTSKQAWVHARSRTHFCPELTHAANTSVETRSATMLIGMNEAVKDTSYVLPVNKFEDETVEDSDIDDTELDQFFALISKY